MPAPGTGETVLDHEAGLLAAPGIEATTVVKGLHAADGGARKVRRPSRRLSDYRLDVPSVQVTSHGPNATGAMLGERLATMMRAPRSIPWRSFRETRDANRVT